MLKEVIAQIEGKVKDLFKSDSSGHDISHLKRVMNLAIRIQKEEGGDEIIVGVSAFLHDVHRLMQNNCGYFVEPVESLPIIRDILKDTSLTQDQIDEICYCIKYHENYNWNGANVDNLNALILQDADNIDACGAIGIGRSFCYGGNNHIVMFDEDIPLENNTKYVESGGNDPSTLHHFYHKLIKLADYMNTKTATKIAKERAKFMLEFIDEFLAEWKGEK